MSFTFFRFPYDLGPFIHFEDANQLSLVFRNELKKAGLASHLRHLIHKGAQERIYIKCLDCDWLLTYIWNKYSDGSCTLHKFVLYHKHGPNDRQTSESYRFESIETLCSLDYKIPLIRTYMEYKWGIQPGTTHNLYYRFRDLIESIKAPTFQEWYRGAKTKLTILSYPKPEQVVFPEIIFLTSKFALNIHKQRGQITGIKILTNKITDLTKNLCTYHCVIFYGIIGDQKRVLYAFSIINTEKSQNLYKAVRMFLECTVGTCETFFIDDEEKLREVIQKLIKEGRFSGQYYTDHESILEKVEDPIIKDMVKNLLNAKKEEDYRKLFVEYSRSKDEERLKHLQNIDEKSHFYCQWNKKKQTFIGKWTSTEGGKFHRLLVDNINIKRSYSHMLIKVQSKFASQIKKYETKCYTIIDNTVSEKCIPFDFVKTYRMKMYREGFRILMREVYGAIFINCEKISNNTYKLEDNKGNINNVVRLNEFVEPEPLMMEIKDEKNSERTCEKEEEEIKMEPKFSCDCGYLEEMGMPCRHMMKILLKEEYKICPYISNYWKIKKDYELFKQYECYSQGKELPKRGRPKKSKRNTQRRTKLGT